MEEHGEHVLLLAGGAYGHFLGPFVGHCGCANFLKTHASFITTYECGVSLFFIHGVQKCLEFLDTLCIIRRQKLLHAGDTAVYNPVPTAPTCKKFIAPVLL